MYVMFRVKRCVSLAHLNEILIPNIFSIQLTRMRVLFTVITATHDFVN